MPRRGCGQRPDRNPHLNRELSQLDFNARVLEMAADGSLPLLDRVNFCSIFSSNTDEFFMVRVAGLMDQLAAGVTRRSPDGLTPRAALAEVRRRSLQPAYDQAKLWKRTLKPGLAAEGIVVADEDLEADELEELERVFESDVFRCSRRLQWGRVSRSRTPRGSR
jgi:polyphosphate kinase